MARFLSETHILWFLLLILCFPITRYLLPILVPFLIGLSLALIAEPAVKWLHQKCKLRPWMATGIGVTGVMILSLTAFTLITSLILRQLRQLSGWLPELTGAIGHGAVLLEQWLLSITAPLPENIRQVTTQITSSIFDGGSGLLQTTVGKLTQMAGAALGKLSHGFVSTVIAVLSAFMFSTRLPQLRQKIHGKIPPKMKAAGKEFRKSLGRWVIAQGKMAGIAFVLLCLGFLLLHIRQPLLWAALVTLVDILPVLGVGTALIPWSIVCYLQGDGLKALGIMGIFLVIWLVRSALEPKLIGKELGLDPLVTLICIYAGFRLWGIAGMLMAPIIAVCLAQMWRQYRVHTDHFGT